MAFEGPFAQQPENAIASFSYAEISDATGNVILYATNGKDSIGNKYYLSKSTLGSSIIAPSSTVTNDNIYHQVIDYDFDLRFNRPQDVKGFIRGNVTLGSASNGSGEYYSIIRLRKVASGITEIEISSVQSEILNIGNTVDDKTFNFSLDASSTSTHFAVGDYLRITMEMWAKTTASSCTVAFGCDPLDRDDDAVNPIINTVHTTIFQIHVPFIIPGL